MSTAPEGVSDLETSLAAIVGAEHVSSGTPAARRDTGKPTFIVAPGSAPEVAELVQLAGRAEAAVIPVGTGMRDALAEPDPGRPRIFVDLRRISHVLRLDETSLVVHVQAGLTAIELEAILGKRGLSLGDYPPSSLSSTVGGLLAVRTPGKLSRRHGFIEDAVLGISAVLADGRTVHTRAAPRRATGPDLARALCGSEGTLGIITSAVLRIHRRADARFLAAYSLPTFADAVGAVRLSLHEEATPAAMRAYDPCAAKLHFGNWSDGQDRALLLVATAGPTDLAACDRDLVASAAMAVGGELADDTLAETWWRSRAGQGEAMQAPHLQVSAKPGAQSPVQLAVAEAAREHGFLCATYASRFDLDGGVLFFTLLDGDENRLEGEALARATEHTLAAAQRAGAYLLGAKTSGLDDYYRALRAELDPQTILNPGALRVELAD